MRLPRLDTLAHRLWADEPGVGGMLLRGLLAPAEALYRTGVAVRNTAYDRRLLGVERVDIPVISVGNVAVGGTGKTPFAHWLAVRLAARGERPAVLHGSYAADAPALHRRWAPDIAVIVESDRVHGAKRAQQAGATAVVLDDAFQHRRLHRDLDIVLVAVEHWPGARRLLPRGPWREPTRALDRAHVIVCTRKTATAAAAAHVAAELAGHVRVPIMTVHLRADGWLHGDAPAGAPPSPALLVAALAWPAIFARDAAAAGADVAETMLFPDHHAYTARDAADIRSRAAGRPIVMTEKDWVKLDGLLDVQSVWLLHQSVVPEHGLGPLDDALDRVLR
ncbi:tetraacyldisaccharide 4'-kinase [soil metagenome]